MTAAPAPAPEPEEPAPGMAEPRTRLERALGYVPRALSSKAHILFLGALLVYLVLLPLSRLYAPTSQAMLIGGNWTNVTSDMGACIAAGGTLHLVRREKKRHLMEAERLRLARETHALLHRVHAAAAAELGHVSGAEAAGG